MSCPSPAPTCNSLGISGPQSTVSSILGTIAGIGSGLGTVGSVIGYVLQTVKGQSLPGPITILGITAPAVVWLAAAVGAIMAWATVFLFWDERCLSNPDTEQGCSAGVIQTFVPAFNSATDQLFPFTAMHNRLDVVVKCVYWGVVTNLAAWVWCNDDTDSSPMLRGYYKTAAVCAAGEGATIGGAIGAVGGIIAGAAIGAAIGCATIIFCIFAILAALLVAAAAVIVAAFAGGQIGKAAAGSSSPTSTAGNTLNVGDYVTTCGGLLTSGDDNGARVYWFVDTTVQHGSSSGPQPFDHTDPDMILVPDACPSCSAPSIQ